MEHIQIALGLLGKRKIQVAEGFGHVDLLRLLRSRIHFDLPGHRELTEAMVKPESALVGQPLNMLYERLDEVQFEVIAIMRHEHVLLPHPGTVLEANDRVVLITSPAAREPLQQYLTSFPPTDAQAAQAETDSQPRS
jgi:NhaP-type Na+/H+ and K+/H+ antiporter